MIETDAGNTPFEVDDLDADTLLALLSDAEKQDRKAGRRKLRYAAHWCALHPGSPEDHQVAGDAFGARDPNSDCDLHIGGEGTPLVASGAAEEFGAALGVATITGLNWLTDALNLNFRLKQTWVRVEALEVPTWKARRLAQLTHQLSQVAAAWVDNELAPRLDQVGLPTIEKVVNTAIAAFCPELIKDKEKAGKDAWGVHLDRTARDNSGVWAGTSSIEAYGDTRDLIEFHALVCAIAEELRKAGDTDTEDQRKAKALGIIGRGSRGSTSPTLVTRLARKLPLPTPPRQPAPRRSPTAAAVAPRPSSTCTSTRATSPNMPCAARPAPGRRPMARSNASAKPPSTCWPTGWGTTSSPSPPSST